MFGDPSFDYRTFDYGRDLRYANDTVPSMNAVSPDLHRFRAHDGKLLMYFGWADNVSSARTGIDYYESLRAAAPGPDRFDAVAVLSRWVENGTAPDRIVASHSTGGHVDRTRPLCPYPQEARWTGNGSTDEAANFTCAPPHDAAPATEGAWLREVQATAK